MKTSDADTSNNERDPLSVHRRAVTIDLHADTVQFMVDEGADINRRLDKTHLDAVRMKEGGLDAQFFSIWVEPNLYGAGGPRCVARADEQLGIGGARRNDGCPGHSGNGALGCGDGRVRPVARDHYQGQQSES